MGIHKKRTAGSIVCILLTALFSVLAVSGCAKTEDAAAGSVEQEEQEVQIGLSFESFVIERWMRERDVFDIKIVLGSLALFFICQEFCNTIVQNAKNVVK